MANQSVVPALAIETPTSVVLETVPNNVVPMKGLRSRSQWHNSPRMQRITGEHGLNLQLELKDARNETLSGGTTVHQGEHAILGQTTIIVSEDECLILSRHVSVGALQFQSADL